MSKLVVILNGPIGVGKSTIGAAVAARLSGACIESDDLGNPDRAWHEQVDVVNEELISTSLAALKEASLVVAALPLESARWDDIRVKLAGKEVTLPEISAMVLMELARSPSSSSDVISIFWSSLFSATFFAASMSLKMGRDNPLAR